MRLSGLPYEPDPGDEAAGSAWLDFQASREVRHTVVRIIASHLRDGVAVSWQGLDFDFTGVVFDGGGFAAVKFSGGTVSFRGTKFSGLVGFMGAEFSGGEVYFTAAKFSEGTVSFEGSRFSGATVGFFAAEFAKGEVGFYNTQFSGGEVYFTAAKFSGAWVGFSGAQFSGGEVDFSGAGDWSVPPAFPWTGTPPQA